MHIILILILLLGLFSVVGLMLMTAVMHICEFFDKIGRWLQWR